MTSNKSRGWPFGLACVLLVASICLPSWLRHDYYPDVLMGMLIGVLAMIVGSWQWSSMTFNQKDNLALATALVVAVTIPTACATGFGLLSGLVLDDGALGITLMVVFGLALGLIVDFLLLCLVVDDDTQSADYDEYYGPQLA